MLTHKDELCARCELILKTKKPAPSHGGSQLCQNRRILASLAYPYVRSNASIASGGAKSHCACSNCF